MINFRLSQIFMDILRGSLITSFEIGAFFLQFMNSWNLKNLNYDLKDLPQVPAPLVRKK